MPEIPPDLEEMLQRGFRYALSLTHDPGQAEEVLQEACLSLLKSGGGWHAGSLMTAVRHRFIDGLRRRGLTMESLEGTGADAVAARSQSSSTVELDRDLEAALRSLRPDEREMLYLSAVEGLSSGEIAQTADRPRGTVLSLLLRAKRKVRQMLIASGKSCGVRGEENHGA